MTARKQASSQENRHIANKKAERSRKLTTAGACNRAHYSPPARAIATRLVIDQVEVGGEEFEALRAPCWCLSSALVLIESELGRPVRTLAFTADVAEVEVHVEDVVHAVAGLHMCRVVEFAAVAASAAPSLRRTTASGPRAIDLA